MFEQMPLFPEPERESLPLTVSQLVGRIRFALESDRELQGVRVEGEVSNFRRAPSGHCYFTLKDAGAELRCVMWRSVARTLNPLPGDGDQVLAYGSISVYEQRGSLQLYVERLEQAGVGQLYREFERLKARLEAEGLFDRQRPLPQFPQRIGVVTSPAAAALRDILNVLARRYPLADVVLSPTMVQGDQAPPQIVAALAALNARDDIDVIIVARGGGSLEDLWAFNDERVARAIAASRIPVVCGVGHETDFSLADFAADRRAPTPSAAAEIATPDLSGARGWVVESQSRLTAAFRLDLERRRSEMESLVRALRHLSPLSRLAQARQQVDDLMGRASSAMEHNWALQREQVEGLTRQLRSLGPQATLERGYAIVRRSDDGQLVRSVAQVAAGDKLTVRVSDDEFDTIVA